MNPNTHPSRQDMPVFMDLKNDFAFKYILGHEKILIKLLNDILQKGIVEIQYLPNDSQLSVIRTRGRSSMSSARTPLERNSWSRCSRPPSLTWMTGSCFTAAAWSAIRSAAETDMERWCCLFQNLSIFAKVPEDAAGFDEVFAVSRVDELSETQIKDYKDAMLSEYEKRVIKEYAYKTGHEEGRAEGRAEGIAEGRAEGLTEGISKGAEQMRESIRARLEKLGLSQELIDEALKA